jgi:hypothetical protein
MEVNCIGIMLNGAVQYYNYADAVYTINAQCSLAPYDLFMAELRSALPPLVRLEPCQN